MTVSLDMPGVGGTSSSDTTGPSTMFASQCWIWSRSAR